MGSPVRTIAVIDDDFRILESLQSLLASFGYKAETYLSAEHFLASDGLLRSDCIIADVHMPTMNGLGLLRHLRSIRCEIPVIVVTGKPTNKSEGFYLGKGANGFFRKPVDGQALVTLINRLLTPHCPG